MASGAPPRLILVLAIDQLRPDRLSSALPGGLGRLMREGRVFADAALEHANTETCPGHATMLTGRHPGPAGIPANEFVDPDTGRLVYCVQDDAPDAAVLGGGMEPAQGRSPRKMRVGALGDWLKASQPGARVFGLSGKDRAAIPLAGQHPDVAYWFDRGPAQGFTTSRYYRSELPEWVRAFNRPANGVPAFLARVPDRWEHTTGDPANGARRDYYPAESAQFSRTSPHPVRDPDVRIFLERLYSTPFLDDVTLDFARGRSRKTRGWGRAQPSICWRFPSPRTISWVTSTVQGARRRATHCCDSMPRLGSSWRFSKHVRARDACWSC